MIVKEIGSVSATGLAFSSHIASLILSLFLFFIPQETDEFFLVNEPNWRLVISLSTLAGLCLFQQ
jgi:hypothetical protein